jgi:hypothetical protein
MEGAEASGGASERPVKGGHPLQTGFVCASEPNVLYRREADEKPLEPGIVFFLGKPSHLFIHRNFEHTSNLTIFTDIFVGMNGKKAALYSEYIID